MNLPAAWTEARKPLMPVSTKSAVLPEKLLQGDQEAPPPTLFEEA